MLQHLTDGNISSIDQIRYTYRDPQQQSPKPLETHDIVTATGASHRDKLGDQHAGRPGESAPAAS
jgi:hypothetical protein